MGWLRVVDPGFFATVQDLGRAGLSHLGVPRGGGVDVLSLRTANRIVGNADGAAAIELTLRGGELLFEDDAAFALTGAAVPATLSPGARPVGTWTPVEARRGEVLRIGQPAWGARTYLGVSGGIDVAPVLGSRSTHVAGAFGGLAGRALRTGDRLPIGGAARAPRAIGAAEVTRLQAALRRSTVEAVDGAHARLFDLRTREAFWRGVFRATDRCDRMGIRLEGPRLPSPIGGALVTEGMPCGAVQVATDGQAIVLLADGPTTGGYPVVACVVAASLPRLAQLRPREGVSFERTTVEAAQKSRALEALLDAALPPW